MFVCVCVKVSTFKGCRRSPAIHAGTATGHQLAVFWSWVCTRCINMHHTYRQRTEDVFLQISSQGTPGTPSPSIGCGWVTWTPSWLAWNSWMMTLFMRRFGSAWNKARMGSNRFMTAQKSNAMHALLVSWVRLLVSLVLHSISQMFEWFGQCLIFETA